MILSIKTVLVLVLFISINICKTTWRSLFLFTQASNGK